jgi:hypothetical protein
MVWITLPQVVGSKLQKVIDEIGTGSHRASAVVAGAFVEEHLTLLLTSRMARDERLETQMFRTGGALADFGVKINLGFFLGLYSKKGWKELDTIRRIRNEFAHKIEIDSFKQQPVKDWCANLQLWKMIKIGIRKSAQGHPHHHSWC